MDTSKLQRLKYIQGTQAWSFSEWFEYFQIGIGGHQYFPD